MRPLLVGPLPVFPSARRCQSSGPVPPSWFRTTSAAYSASRFADVLQPAAGPGVHRVSLRLAAFTPLTHPRLRAGRAVGPIPTMPHPSEDSPRPQPYDVTAAAAFLPFAVPTIIAACAEITAVEPPAPKRERTRHPRTDAAEAAPTVDGTPPDKRLRARATKHPKMPVAGRGPSTGSEDLIGVGSSSLRDQPLPAGRAVRRSVGFKALLRVRVRCAPLRCRRRTPYPPWAFPPPRFPPNRRRSPEGDEHRPVDAPPKGPVTSSDPPGLSPADRADPKAERPCTEVRRHPSTGCDRNRPAESVRNRGWRFDRPTRARRPSRGGRHRRPSWGF